MSISGIFKILLIPLFIMQVGILSSQVVINEILASNTLVIADPDFGTYCDWIELFNPSSNAADLSGYFLSDDSGNLTKWQFQPGTIINAGNYLLVFADGSGIGNHPDFSLAKVGEQVLLSNSEGELIDSITFPYQLTDVSYGRKTDDSTVFGYFEDATPGNKNSDQFISGISQEPRFSKEGGFYSGSQILEINASSQNAEIFYTLDGTEPSTNSLKYAEPLVLAKTTVIRVKTFESGLLPGLTITQSYFIDEPMNLPVISLVTDPDHFFSNETGIYVQGTAGVPGYCTNVPHNVNQDWERPVNIELFEKDGTTGINQLAGVKIFGGCSRVRYPIKSLAFYARKEYETSSFSYQLFPDKPSEEYETFILRTSADDQPFTLFKDALTQMVVKDVIDVDVQAYRPMVLYINGEYWGIHNLREKINEHYANDNFGVNPDSVDVLKRNPENPWDIVHGSADHYNSMMEYLRSNDISLPVHYDYISKQMDIDEYINYQVIQIFFGGRDWPGNNIKFWRSREKPYDRWRWVLYDLDHTFTEYFSDIMDEATEIDCGCDWPNPPWSTYLFRRLLENETFRNEFIQKFFVYSESHFSRERIHGIIDQLQAEIAPEIPRHIERWGGQKTDLPDNTWVSPIFSSVGQWEDNVRKMRTFTDTRHEMAKKHVMDYFDLSGLNGFSARVEPANLGSIMMGNAVITQTGVTADIITGQKMKISCKPETGYILSHWDLTSSQEYDSILISRGDSWKYIESWYDPAYNWYHADYDDAHWKTGFAELGYGDGDETTVIGYGGDPQNKMHTAWFRKKFIIEDKSEFIRFTVHLLRDDAARVFLNGTEVIRENLNRWWVDGNTLAINTINGADEKFFHTFPLNPALFLEGENIIAVEVHQASAGSSDLSFDLDLVATRLDGANSAIFHQNDLEFFLNNNKSFIAYIIPDTNRVEAIFINEIVAKNSTGFTDEKGDFEDWIELYNAGTQPVNLAGLLLSDALPAIDAWQIPDGYPEITTIMPDGFLVFVADNETEEGLLHTNFKLDRDGDEIALLQIIGKDTLVIDHMKFGRQNENVSLGRFPDGSEIFELMTEPTPGVKNIYKSVGTPFADAKQLSDDIIVYPVPTDGQVIVRYSSVSGTNALPVHIFMYSGTGRLISVSEHLSTEIIGLSLENQPEGLYLLRIVCNNKEYNKKIIKY